MLSLSTKVNSLVSVEFLKVKSKHVSHASAMSCIYREGGVTFRLSEGEGSVRHGPVDDRCKGCTGETDGETSRPASETTLISPRRDHRQADSHRVIQGVSCLPLSILVGLITRYSVKMFQYCWIASVKQMEVENFTKEKYHGLPYFQL